MTKTLPLYSDPPNSVEEYRQRVIDLISKGWCKHTYALDEMGMTVDLLSPQACQVCLVGALRRAASVYYLSASSIVSSFKAALIDELRMDTLTRTTYLLSSFNDTPGRTVEEVIELVKCVKVKE